MYAVTLAFAFTVLASHSEPITFGTTPNPSLPGQTVTLRSSATFSPPHVVFYDGETPIGTATPDDTSSYALSTTMLSVGSHVLTARWQGQASAPVIHVVLAQAPADPPAPATASVANGSKLFEHPGVAAAFITFLGIVAIIALRR